MKGRNIHEIKAKQNIEYHRKRIGVIDKKINQYLTNEYLRGEIDEVLTLKDGTMAPLDFKFAEYKGRIFRTYKTQLACYSILIENNFGRRVNRGYLVYIRSKNKLMEVPIEERDKHKVIEAANSILTIINKNMYPPGTRDKKKCVNCTYKNVCTM